MKPNTQQFIPNSKEFPMEVFDIEVKPVLSCIAKILGKDDNSTVEKSILGMFIMMMKLGLALDIPSYWQEVVKSKLMSLSLTGSFRFPSLIVYLFLYQNVEEFMHLGLNIMDMNKKRQSMIFWTNIVRKEQNEGGLFDFAGHFISFAYKVLNVSSPPCFLPKAQEFLHLGTNCKFGD